MSTAAISQPGPRVQPGQRPPGAGDRPVTVSKAVVAASVAGNALEFYDFTTYAFFAVYIGKAFFPAATPMGSLLLSVAVFGVGFIARPLGGVLIGAFADRAGRKPAMLLTIGLITVGTLGLACTPGYASIGMAAPIIVVVCRLVQGLALGGEVGPSTAFLLEAAPLGRRGFFASWQLSSQGMSTLVAGLIGVSVSAALSPADLQAWGWRIPFAIGLLLLPVAAYMRRAMPETLHSEPAARAGAASESTLRGHWGVILLCVVMIMGGTVSTYVGNYMTTYAISTLKLPATAAMAATVAVGLTITVFSVLGGMLADRFGRKPTMIWPRIALAILTVPAFETLVAHPDVPTLIAVSVLLSALTAITGCASIVTIPELLPRNIRATGLCIAYAVGVSLFGGSTQFLVTWLLEATHNPAAPAWYVTVTSLISLLAMFALPESRGRHAT